MNTQNTQKTVRSNSDPRYYLRFLLMAMVALGFAAWFGYDGAIGYPNQRERALEYKKLVEEGRENEWVKHALERGWPTALPGEPKDQHDFTVQFIYAAMAGAGGLALLVFVLRSRGRWIEANEKGLNSSWGQSFTYEQVVTLDKKRWRNKGIAKVIYNDGARRRFIIDDYKFERYPTDDILRVLEQHIAPEKIVGGPPEPPPEEDAKESQEPVAEESGKSSG